MQSQLVYACPHSHQDDTYGCEQYYSSKQVPIRKELALKITT